MSLFASFAQAKAGAHPASPEFINGDSGAPDDASPQRRLFDYRSERRLRSSSFTRTAQSWRLATEHKRKLAMDTINGSVIISYNPRKEIYTFRFGPSSSVNAHGSAHSACQPDGRSCGKVRVNLTDALHFLQTAGKSDATALLAKTRVEGGTSVQVSITRNQHGDLLAA